MKKIIRITALLILLSVAFGYAVPAKAAYQYKVTVSGGLYGTVSGGENIPIPYNGSIDLGDYQPTVTNSKYYFKGWHLAGQEYDPTIAVDDVIPVTEDMTIVAAYGIKGVMKELVIHYVYKSNNATAHPDTIYYGNVKDKPRVAAAHVEGYHPDYNYKTITLNGDPTHDVITFYYTKNTTTTVVTGGGGGGGGTVVRPRPVLVDDMEVDNPEIDDGMEDTEGNPIDDPNAGGEVEDLPGGTYFPSGGYSDTDDMNGGTPYQGDFTPYTPLEEEPGDLLDLDDEDVPLAGPDYWNSNGYEDDASSSLHSAWLAAGIGAVALLALIAAIVFLLMRRKRKLNETSEEQ